MSAHAETGSEDRLLTIEEYERLPDDPYWRDELVRGRVVREPPPGYEHGGLEIRLGSRLYAFVERHALGRVFTNTGYVLSTEPATVRGPDVSFVSVGRTHERLSAFRGYMHLAPDLAVEIVSPSNTAAGIQDKVLQYLDAGSRLVWVIYPGTRTVAVHRPDGDVRLLRERDVLDGGGVLPGFRLPLDELFGA